MTDDDQTRDVHKKVKINFYWHYFSHIFVSPTDDIEGLVQERRNSSALAMELRLSSTNPSI